MNQYKGGYGADPATASIMPQYDANACTTCGEAGHSAERCPNSQVCEVVKNRQFYTPNTAINLFCSFSFAVAAVALVMKPGTALRTEAHHRVMVPHSNRRRRRRLAMTTPPSTFPDYQLISQSAGSLTFSDQLA